MIGSKGSQIDRQMKISARACYYWCGATGHSIAHPRRKRPAPHRRPPERPPRPGSGATICLSTRRAIEGRCARRRVPTTRVTELASRRGAFRAAVGATRWGRPRGRAGSASALLLHVDEEEGADDEADGEDGACGAARRPRARAGIRGTPWTRRRRARRRCRRRSSTRPARARARRRRASRGRGARACILGSTAQMFDLPS